MSQRQSFLHHVGLRTADLDAATGWYRAYFGAHVTWSTDVFSEVTRTRVPGIRRMSEVDLGSVRVHLMECDEAVQPDSGVAQHLCFEVATLDELVKRRDEWFAVAHATAAPFSSPEEPTAVITDERGTASFYCRDLDGLEIEFTHMANHEG